MKGYAPMCYVVGLVNFGGVCGKENGLVYLLSFFRRDSKYVYIKINDLPKSADNKIKNAHTSLTEAKLRTRTRSEKTIFQTRK